MTRKIAPLTVTVVLVAALYLSVDIREILAALESARWSPLLGALLIFVPIFVLRGMILVMLFGGRLTLRSAILCILGGSSLNVLLPSKGGDFAKSFFLVARTGSNLSHCLALTALERAVDVSILAAIALFGLAVFRTEAPFALIATATAVAILAGSAAGIIIGRNFSRESRLGRWLVKLPKVGSFLAASLEIVRGVLRSPRIIGVVGLTVAVWGVQLLQFLLFFETMNFAGPWTTIPALVPLVIFVGLLPITVAGIGTRDAALVFLFAPWADTATMLGIALLTHLRFIIPGLAGSLAMGRLIPKPGSD